MPVTPKRTPKSCGSRHNVQPCAMSPESVGNHWPQTKDRVSYTEAMCGTVKIDNSPSCPTPITGVAHAIQKVRQSSLSAPNAHPLRYEFVPSGSVGSVKWIEYRSLLWSGSLSTMRILPAAVITTLVSLEECWIESLGITTEATTCTSSISKHPI